ncbi:purple acid phosphatase [Plakobranchus ocellatus]|uniref:Purple acid phosphatase n=1 Tax=Plakobranchus ocellatus TaxID=259542 RepID=A0AAV4CUD5_9GAST|nr:purple acid phosphatase [Plakobranchus ocellatus]
MELQQRVLFTILVFGLACSVHGIVWYEPEQVHIAIGANPDEMVIVWNTVNDTGESKVLYGSGGKLNQTASGSRTKFVDGGEEKRSQFIHRVVLQGLSEKTEYAYIVGSSLAWSNSFSFKTWPRGEKWSPRIALFGDMGNENAQSLPRLQVETMQGMYDAILHVGDFAYDMDEDNARVGDNFMRQIEPMASKIPYLTCPGNHEQAYNFSNYRNRFWMPEDENKQMYYSFTIGPVRFLSLATELIFFPQYGLVPIVEQYKWLKRTLAEANKPENRAKHPWIVAFGHRPMYCNNDDVDDCTHHESLVRVGIPILHLLGWEKLFMEYGVDLAVWAHEHSYERMWPVYDRQVMNASAQAPYTNPKAPVHIVTGSAGCREIHDNFTTNPQPWSAFRSLDYGYTRMHVINTTHLYLEQVSDDKGGLVIDKMTLIKERHGPHDPNPRDVTPKGDPLMKLWNTWGKYVNIDTYSKK